MHFLTVFCTRCGLQLLGRAEQISNYVRRGQSEAWTEITLSGGPGMRDHLVRRDIKLEFSEENGERKVATRSKWKVNGECRAWMAKTARFARRGHLHL